MNGVLAGTEIAVVSIRASRVQQLADEKGRAGRALAGIRSQPERFFATVQIGITVVGATAAAFGGSTLALDLAPKLAGLPLVGPHADRVALGIVVALVSFLSLVLGELVPKSLALRYAESYGLLVARPLLGLSRAASPLVWLLTGTSNLLLRFFGDSTTFSESRISTDELRQVLDSAKESGSIHPAATEIATRALDFGSLTAGHVMVPRQRVVTVPLDASPEQLRDVLLEHGHTRMPVYATDRDEIVGYVNVKDVLALAWERPLIVLSDLMRPALFVPETKPAIDLLGEMKVRRVPLAVVVDEAGGLSGIVTLEDLLEELVGEILSEHGKSAVAAPEFGGDGTAIVPGDTPIRDLNRAMTLELQEGAGWTTVGGLCMALAERVPETGEELRAEDGTLLTVLEATDRRVLRVRVRPPAKALPSAPAS